MINIFIENKKLKEENKKLKIKINEIEKENNNTLMKREEYYDRLLKTKIEYIKADYKTKINRKKEVKKICKNLESRINADILNLNSDDIIILNNINAYLKLLDYLKEE